jgi:zinc and cadmium transporter
MNQLFLYSLIGGLFSLIGGGFLLWKPQITQKLLLSLIAFGAGSFLGAAFLDILPEALESVDEAHPILGATLAGFLIFFIAERLIMKYFKNKNNTHHHDEHTESLPFLLIAGDCLHNFMDGIVIALAFAADPTLGLSAALAIAAHEIPQEIGDFSILLQLGWKKSRVILVNVLQSLLTIPGVVVGYYLGTQLEPQLPFMLGATAGIFIYIAASDLIPMLHHQGGHKYAYRIIIPMIVGVIAVWQLAQLAHGH